MAAPLRWRLALRLVAVAAAGVLLLLVALRFARGRADAMHEGFSGDPVTAAGDVAAALEAAVAAVPGAEGDACVVLAAARQLLRQQAVADAGATQGAAVDAATAAADTKFDADHAAALAHTAGGVQRLLDAADPDNCVEVTALPPLACGSGAGSAGAPVPAAPAPDPAAPGSPAGAAARRLHAAVSAAMAALPRLGAVDAAAGVAKAPVAAATTATAAASAATAAATSAATEGFTGVCPRKAARAAEDALAASVTSPDQLLPRIAVAQGLLDYYQRVLDGGRELRQAVDALQAQQADASAAVATYT